MLKTHLVSLRTLRDLVGSHCELSTLNDINIIPLRGGVRLGRGGRGTISGSISLSGIDSWLGLRRDVLLYLEEVAVS